MPAVTAKKIAGKYRVVIADTRRLERTQYGVPRDGGGHRGKAKADRQCQYINDAISKASKP